MTTETAINELARAQFGVFTRTQASVRGATDAFLRHRVEKGLYRVVRRGIYVVEAVPPRWEQDVMAFCLTSPGVWAARRTAAALWQMPGFAAKGPLEFSAIRNVRSRPGFHVRRLRNLPRCDVTCVGPIPATSPTRTILDLSSVVSEAQLEIALDDAIRRGLTSVSYVERRLGDVSGHANIRGLAIRRLLDDRKEPGGAPESPLETRTIQALRRHGLPIPHRQYEIRHLDKFVARVDLAYPAQKIAIEVDSYEYHSGRRQWESDLVRRNALEAAGWRVLHVTAYQLRFHLQAFIATVREALGAKNGRQQSLYDS